MTQTIAVDSPSTNAYQVSNLPSGTFYFAVAALASDGTHSIESSVATKTIL
jgi:hypothetical protein